MALDGQNVVYSANWDGKPSRNIFRSNRKSGSSLFWIEVCGIIFAFAGWRTCNGGLKKYTLMQMPFAGGMPREILDLVSDADWSPDGKSLLVCRSNKTIEFPVGK